MFSLKFLLVILGGIFTGILYFGLGLDSFGVSNGADWIPDQPGIRFSKYGITYTNPFNATASDGDSDLDGFSVEIALLPATYNVEGVKFVWAVHGGEDINQLVMGQWRSRFIIMNRDREDSKGKNSRISVKDASLVPRKRFVTITSGTDGTKIYLDGHLVRTKKDLFLKIPIRDKTRLIIGNSANGKYPWHGEVYGMAIYRYTLKEKDVVRHFANWSRNQSFFFAKNEKPILIYFFDEMTGTIVRDHSGANRHLHMPDNAKIPEPKIFFRTYNGLDLDHLNIGDIIINFLGFIPLGFILSATLMRFGGNFKKHAIFIAVGGCFAASLTIEVIQAWIPMRSSDLIDLAFNTLGGLVGSVLYLTISVFTDKEFDTFTLTF